MVAGIAITGDMTPEDLQAYAERVRERLKTDKRIAQVRLLGFSGQDISIEIPVEALRRYGLALGDLTAALGRQSLDMPAGIMETGDGDLIVRFIGQRRKPAEFADLVAGFLSSL